MAGHSKWANIQHRKGKVDAKRAKAFSVLSREITVCVRSGGGDPNFNVRLRTLIEKAKWANMPADNITRAIQKGTGEIPGVVYEEIVYEGYGPAGVAMVVECTTDNKTRTAAEVRAAFTKHGGNLAGAGAVAFNFAHRGHIIIGRSIITEDKLMELVLGAGADDLQSFDTHYEVFTTPHAHAGVADALNKEKLEIAQSEVAYLPNVTVPVSAQDRQKLEALAAAIEELDDVQHVWHNATEE